MSYTDQTPVFLAPGEPQDISEDYWVATLEAAGSFDADALWAPYPRDERPAVARVLYGIVTAAGHRASYWLAKPFEEHTAGTNENSVLWRHQTRSWGNATSVRDPSVTGWEMVFDEARDRSYVRYANVIDSLKDALYRITDPTYVYVKEGRTTVREVGERFVGLSENTDRYIAGLVTRMNRYLREQVHPTMALTDTIRERITARGVEVHDIRHRMIRDGAYERRPNSAWEYVGVHHTAVSRGVRSLKGDIDSWVGHSRYHVQTRGWPGIAYFIGVSQSGRVFILRDVEEMGFHAFRANENTLAICGDLAESNTPTAALLEALTAVLHVLHFQTPELPNLGGYQHTYGHQELKFIDPQNQTGCPGRLMPFVAEYRAGKHLPDAGELPKGDGPPELPATVPDPWEDKNPWRKGLWIPVPFVEHIKAREWMAFGYCLAPAEIEGNVLVQYFERARLELHRNGTITRGLVGLEAMQAKYPERTF